ncbi:MAG: lamin tail domain-containing protein [Verrucomicrobiota bacterium]
MYSSAFARFPIFAATLLPSILLADAVVTFNELNYNPASAQETEWIELHNQMAVNVDMSGWSLDDGVNYTFAHGTVIPAGGYLIVAKDPSHAAFSGVTGVLGPFSGSLSNSGETLELLNRSGRLMDTLTYSDIGDWPVAADGVGATLAKRRPGMRSDTAVSWTASLTSGGNPAVVNFTPPGAPVSHALVARDSLWKYNDTNTAPVAGWSQVAYNDSAWPSGPALFGTASSGPVLTVTSTLVERFRAGALVGVANGSTFSPWNDSATADGVSQNATASGNPTYQTNVTQTSEPAVRFDGNDEFRTTQSPGISPTSGFAYFIVCKANSLSNEGRYLIDRNNSIADPPLVSLKVSNNRYEFQKRNDDNSNLGGPVSNTQVSANQFQIVALRRNPTAARFEIWVNGVMEGSTPDLGGNLTPQPIVIGRHAEDINQGFNGDIAELLVYRDALSETDFQAAGAYLEARYGLDTAFPDTSVATVLAPSTTTSYFRKTFNFSGDTARTALLLDQTVADGAVFYLNGHEVSRTHLAAGPVTHATAALADIPQPAASGPQAFPATHLAQGTNVLAVSLHKATAGEGAFFAATLTGIESPPSPQQAAILQLNEIAGTGDASFFIELRNPGSMPVSTAGYTLSIAGGASFALPTAMVPAQGIVSFTEAQLGYRPAAGDKIVLLASASRIADAQVATTLPGGRRETYPNPWQRPSATTPGTANQFNLTSDIVIHEICYKAPDLAPVPGTAPVTSSIPLVSFSSTWRYNPSGPNLGAGWASVAHPVGGGWLSGPGTLGYSTTPLPLAIATPLNSPPANNPFIVTYYFETDFNLSALQAANLSQLSLNHLIDDGAVIYLNGVELTRYNMPAGTITSSMPAASGVGTPAVVGPTAVVVPPGTAIAGTNRLSVEVHQGSTTSSSDIVFGLEATGIIVTDPGIPHVPQRSSEQEWIELFNRGTTPVDLSGWKFSTGLTYDFPPGTTLGAGEFLVVAGDPALVPTAAGVVLGPWSGGLSGKGELVRLLDASGNTADEVSYLDGGRWPGTADGGGSTLELRDARSDNALPESWAASDEGANRVWQTFTYQGVAAASAVGPDGQWREFILGLLDEGEVLLDDITVTENPGSSPVAMITGGDFESGVPNWKFLGNHQDARIVTDPENAANHVLYLNATGATEHMHNHVATTLAAARSIVNGRTYQISFRARWLSGSNKLNTRLYFNRLARTTSLERPQTLGTPCAANSTATPNIGPGFTALSHSPTVPEPGQAVTVTARAVDADGLGSLTLHHSHNGGAYNAVAMAANGDGSFSATLPGFFAASVVNFYVEASDAAAIPATAFFPAGGPQSHAIYQVNDGLAATNGLHNIRIIMNPSDKARLYQTTNLMSNGRIGCTVIYQENEVYYNVGVRLKSSQRGRPVASRVGFNLSFNDDQLFRGIHKTIAIDRSEGQSVGAQEIIYDHMMNASGGIPAEYNDLIKVIAPDPAHTSTAILQLARFGSEFLDSQFENGADGTVYEYELIYYPTTADAQGYKLPQPDDVVGVDMTSLGEDQENYRWSYLSKNNEDKNDYAGVIEMCQLFDKSGAEFDTSVHEVLDVDQWLRALAYSCASGAVDSFFSNANHNGQFYARPSDGRMLYFPHDLDYFDGNLPIFANTELQKLTADPVRKRLYLGHLYDICTTVFNQSYMAAWTSHFGSLLAGENFPAHLSYINTRSNYILSQINAEIAPQAFAITTNGGADFTTDDTPVALAGQGWVNVREIRQAGSSTPLAVQWTSANTWETVVPLSGGVTTLVLEAVDFSGMVVGTDSITVTNSGNTQLPAASNLVVSEIYYNPQVTDDVSEYIELLNISPTATLDLSGLAFTEGIAFTFPNETRLAPGARILVIKSAAGFAAEFGSGHAVAGVFTGSLENSGETITLRRADNTLVRSFAYSDDAPWPVIADGGGYSLVLVAPHSNPDHSDPMSWRSSVIVGGSPGGSDALSYANWKSIHGNPADGDDADGDGFTTRVEYALGGDPQIANPNIAPSFVLEPAGSMLVSITRRADAEGVTIEPESSIHLVQWSTPAGLSKISNVRESGTPEVERLTFRIPAPVGANRHFIRFRFR